MTLAVVLVVYLAGYVYTARRTAWQIMVLREQVERRYTGGHFIDYGVPCTVSERLWSYLGGIGIALVWPAALLAMAMFRRLPATPVQTQARIEQQEARIAELEKELAIGQEPAPRQQPEPPQRVRRERAEVWTDVKRKLRLAEEGE